MREAWLAPCLEATLRAHREGHSRLQLSPSPARLSAPLFPVGFNFPQPASVQRPWNVLTRTPSPDPSPPPLRQSSHFFPCGGEAGSMLPASST